MALLCRGNPRGARRKRQGDHRLVSEEVGYYALQRTPEGHSAGDRKNTQPVAARNGGRWYGEPTAFPRDSAKDRVLADGTWAVKCLDD